MQMPHTHTHTHTHTLLVSVVTYVAMTPSLQAPLGSFRSHLWVLPQNLVSRDHYVSTGNLVQLVKAPETVAWTYQSVVAKRSRGQGF